MGKIFLSPSDSTAILVQISPNPTISCFTKPTAREINLVKGGKETINVPPLLFTQGIVENFGLGFEQHLFNSPEFSIYRTELDNKEKLNATPFIFANIHPDGKICWGKNAKPNDIKRASAMFFSAPFNEELVNLALYEQTLTDLPGEKEQLLKELIGDQTYCGIPLADLKQGIFAKLITLMQNMKLPINDLELRLAEAREIYETGINEPGFRLLRALWNIFPWPDEPSGYFKNISLICHHDQLIMLNEFNEYQKTLQGFVKSEQAAKANLEKVGDCICSNCIIVRENALQLIKNAGLLAKLNADPFIGKLAIAPLISEIPGLNKTIESFTRGQASRKLKNYLSNCKDYGTLKDLSARFMGTTFVGGRGECDGVYISTSVPDLALVPPEHQFSCGKDVKCIVAFIRRVHSWRYRAMIGGKEYGLATDDNGNGLIISELAVEAAK